MDPDEGDRPGAETFRATTYGESFADVYDEWYPDVSDAAGTVDLVRDLASGLPGRVVEMGVGTGRLAIPLAEAGLPVVGLDVSAPMLARLAAKPGSAKLVWALGDMAAPPLRDGTAAVVLVAYNTLFNLTTEAQQRAALREAARLLVPGGRLVVEAFVPPAPDEGPSGDVSVRTVDADRVVLVAAERDAAAQTITGQHVELSGAGVRMRPWKVRYLYVDQLDGLAAGAGLALEARYAGWDRSPFGEAGTHHVSVYRR